MKLASSLWLLGRVRRQSGSNTSVSFKAFKLYVSTAVVIIGVFLVVRIQDHVKLNILSGKS
mgnify:CR=1